MREQHTDEALIEVGRELLRDEARCIAAAADRLGEELLAAARALCACGGRVVVSGLGKSGHVGRKVAATLASLGIPAFFLHAAEASHGDLGMVCPEDVGVLISNSGETAEVVSLIPHFRRIGAKLIALTGRASSTLAREADVAIDTSVEREADPLGLAPTNSTAVQMACGDAIAGIAATIKGFRSEDFALVHPGGSLGKRLLLRVRDVMGKGGDMPTTLESESVREALFDITSKGYGATIVVDGAGALRGIYTDGDLRRSMERHGTEALDMPVSDVMTRTPRTISPDALASEAEGVMERAEVSVLVAVEDGRPVGIVHIHELLKAGI